MYIGTLISIFWNWMTVTEFYGLGFTFSQLFIFVLIADGAIKVIKMAFGLGGSDTKGGNNKKISINRDRKGDEK